MLGLNFKRKLCLFSGIIVFCFFNHLTADEFPFTPPENFTLSPKYIGLHHPVTTKSRLAQLYFDQGLTFIYAFNHDAAYWSFLRASQVDPEMPMAYWGMALALGKNINMDVTEKRGKLAFDLSQKAVQLSSHASPEEQNYIVALSKRYSDKKEADKKELNKIYSDEMRSLSTKYPEDLDAAVLFTESLLDLNPWGQWSPEGKPLEGTMEAVNTLESVLLREPDHLGANHYYVHTIEASQHPERALMSAHRLSKLLPSSGHILHMPAHIYILVGDYHRASLVNEEAVAADREYIREYGMGGIYPVHYLSHNLYFLSRAYSMEGRFADAIRAANELADLYIPHFKSMPELEYYAPTPLLTLVRFHKWKEILTLPPFQKEMVASNAMLAFARAMALTKLGKIDEAKKEREIFDDRKTKVSNDLDYGYNKASVILSIASFVLNASIAEAQNQIPQAIDLLKQAIKIQDSLKYNEPSDWFFSIREYLGAVLYKNQKYDEALEVFREDLNKHPRNGRSLFGLKKTLETLNKRDDLYWINQSYDKAWKYSDMDLNMDSL